MSEHYCYLESVELFAFFNCSHLDTSVVNFTCYLQAQGLDLGNPLALLYVILFMHGDNALVACF